MQTPCIQSRQFALHTTAAQPSSPRGGCFCPLHWPGQHHAKHTHAAVVKASPGLGRGCAHTGLVMYSCEARARAAGCCPCRRRHQPGTETLRALRGLPRRPGPDGARHDHGPSNRREVPRTGVMDGAESTSSAPGGGRGSTPYALAAQVDQRWQLVRDAENRLRIRRKMRTKNFVKVRQPGRGRLSGSALVLGPGCPHCFAVIVVVAHTACITMRACVRWRPAAGTRPASQSGRRGRGGGAPSRPAFGGEAALRPLASAQTQGCKRQQ